MDRDRQQKCGDTKAICRQESLPHLKSFGDLR